MRTLNNNKKNSISDKSRIEAKGGYSSGEDVTSGSGGIVIFDGGFEVPQNRVITNGGVASYESENGCANGASGTVFRIEEDSLNLDNKGIPTLASTTIEIPEDRQHNGSKGIPELASNVVIRGNSRLVINGEHFGLTFNALTMYDNS